MIVTDNVGGDGVDRLSGIETISFADVSATFTNGTFQPIVVGENATLLEDGSISFSSSALLANDTDIDGGSLSVTGAGGAVNGSVNFSDGTVTYTPNANFSGADSFTYTISDGQGGTATATVALEVTAVNDAPVGQDSSAGGDEDAAIEGVVSATDVDGDTLNYSVGSGPSNGSVTVNKNGSYVYTPNSNYHGADTFTYIATDGKGGTATGIVTLTVTALNDAPIVGAVSVVVSEDDATSGKLTASDVDSDELTFELRSTAENGTAVVNEDGSYSYTPNANYAGSDSFTYSVSDGNGGITAGTVSVSVSAVNDGPTTPGASALVVEDETFSGTLTGVDVDGDSLSFALSSGASNGVAIVGVDGSYTYTPKPAYAGPDSFTYTVSDGNGGLSTGTVSVTVANVNDAPVTSGLNVTTDE
ncbi:MAG: tandem-95 repeat protein, partial [Alphaproteobacteria bacterium]